MRWISLPVEIAATLLRHRELLGQFIRRDVGGRYRGTYLGLLWSFVIPLLMMAVYTFVFGVVLRARWPGMEQSSVGAFAVMLFAGLVPFNFFSEVVSRAPTLIIVNPNYVKKVVFPLEILPVSLTGAALCHCLLSVAVLLAGAAVFLHSLSWSVLLLPLVLLPLVLLALGLAWLLAALAVFVRDVVYAMGVVLSLCLFLTPIFYPLERVPARLRLVLALNPLAAVVDGFRRVIALGRPPDWPALAYALLVSLVVFAGGYAFFVRMKRSFADVL
jgi:lipopolysaccharide transport system permease protein